MDDRAWFAVQTRSRYEKKVAAELNQKAIEVFLPLQSCVHQWSDRRQIVQLPLFPSYLFVRIPKILDQRIAVLRTNGVTCLVGSKGTGTSIPESEIESVRIALQRGIARPHAFLRIGQRVRIRGGSFDGVEGILVEDHQDLSLVVSINIIQRSIAVRIAGYQVEAA